MEPVDSEPDFTNPFRRRPDREEAEFAAGGGAPSALPTPLLYRAQDWLYDMAGHKHMIIFNHYRYQKSRFFRKQPTKRHGTARDVARLTAVFAARGFRVDMSADDILVGGGAPTF